jgi:1-acyl-sn-glycerol-3-phosphate acyltransferase
MGEAEIIPIESARTAQRKPREKCAATTSSGRPCRNFAIAGSTYCRVHSSEEVARTRHPSHRARTERATADAPSPRSFFEWAESFIERRLSGDYPIDDFGYDSELAREVMLPLAKPLYDNYFRVRTYGIERIPDVGPALLVGNHSGTIPLDAVMVQYAVANEHPNRRTVRNVAANLAFTMPFFGPLARKTGNAVAHDDDAQELLRRGELVGVFPEGFKGVGKGWRERYKLQRFGRGGFVKLALQMRVPVIPVAIVGAEEAYPMIANAKWLARTFGFPYFPITPTWPLLGPLGAIPLPSRWVIEFGEPIPMDDYPEDAHDDAMLVFDLSDRIRDTIQQMLYRNLSKRGGAFF